MLPNTHDWRPTDTVRSLTCLVTRALGTRLRPGFNGIISVTTYPALLEFFNKIMSLAVFEPGIEKGETHVSPS